MSVPTDDGARWDVIVLGGDLEGLACAAEAARGGLRTLLVAREERPGASARAEELAPGFAAQGLVDDLDTVARELLEPLELDAHGLAWYPTARPRFGAAPAGGVARVDEDASVARAFGPEAAARLGRWRSFLHRVAPAVLPVWNDAPPELERIVPADALELAKRAFGLRRLGKQDLFELLHVVPQAAWDLAEERFDRGAFGAARVAPALLALPHGPRAPGSAAQVLLEDLTRGPAPVGGAPALARALSGACVRFGAGLRLGVAPERILLHRDRVQGVLLADGTELHAPAVVATEGLATTLRESFEPNELPDSLAALAETWRTRGLVAVVRLAFRRSPLADLDRPVRVVGVRDLAAVETSLDAHWLGELPERPACTFDLDPGGAPTGGAIVTALLHGVGRPAAGWNEARRAGLARVARTTLAETLGRNDDPVETQVLTPDDLAQRYRLDGGHLFGAESSLDRLWLRRPHLTVARYATQLPGFYLGGRAAHPGGPFRTGAGILAARRVVQDARAAASGRP